MTHLKVAHDETVYLRIHNSTYRLEMRVSSADYVDDTDFHFE